MTTLLGAAAPLASARLHPSQLIEGSLKGSRLFSGVSPRSLAIIAAGTQRRTFSRGEHVWEPGMSASHFTVIVSGLVKIVRGARGECIVGLFGPRESVGDAAVVSGGNYPNACVCASEKATLLRIEAGPVLELMTTDETVARAIRKALIEHTRALHEKIDVMSAGSVPARLARLLIGLVERFGDEQESGGSFLPLSLSRAELSCLIGARVETTIRTLSRWQREGVLTSSKDGLLILKPEVLAEATGSELAGEE